MNEWMDKIIIDRIWAEPIIVNTVSAAWNEIRKIRDTVPFEELNGQILTVTIPESLRRGRIPIRILCRANKNGKIEFKDYDKVADREEKKAAAKENED